MRPHVLLLRPPDSGPGPLSEVAVVAHIPVVVVEPLPGSVERVASLLGGCDWLVLTSPRAPRMLSSLAPEIRRLQQQGRLRIAAVGPKTRAALEALGLRVDYVPREYRGAALARELLSLQPRPRCALIPRSEKAVPDLVRVLRENKVEALEIPLYRVLEDEPMARAAASVADLFDYVVFTSPSIVEAFTRHYPRPGSPGFTPVAIGPTTASKMRELGYPRPLTPESYTLEAVAELVARHWEAKTRGGRA